MQPQHPQSHYIVGGKGTSVVIIIIIILLILRCCRHRSLLLFLVIAVVVVVNIDNSHVTSSSTKTTTTTCILGGAVTAAATAAVQHRSRISSSNIAGWCGGACGGGSVRSYSTSSSALQLLLLLSDHYQRSLCRPPPLLLLQQRRFSRSFSLSSSPFLQKVKHQQQQQQQMSTTTTTTTAVSATAAGSDSNHNNNHTMYDDDGKNLNKPLLRFCDIGANLLDERYLQGIYRGTYRHEPDIEYVIQRAAKAGVQRIILTAGTINESRKAIQMARIWNQKYYYNKDQEEESRPLPSIHFTCTVGVHPTRCSQVFENTNNNDDDEDGTTTTKADTETEEERVNRLLDELLALCQDGMTDQTVVAIGEIGLDYDRLEFCPKEVQQKYFILQLQKLAKSTQLPLFLHNRNTGHDLYHLLQQHRDCWTTGVVHSFDDTIDLATKFTNELGLYIGINGCSLRTEENLQTVAQIPLNRILLETDCPYCEVRSTHVGFKYIQTKIPAVAEKKYVAGSCVKSRQEPCHIRQIAEILSSIHNVDLATVANTTYNNTLQLFFFGRREEEET